eukprot:TRINITY_DN10988_c0_g1_i2.p1 TRINITY_DN10988_c0_g1~~TRINITY_DN10988_c0_g1_i2.p1  ORF type:complete len:352 (+),score=44.67 TRINITY_DN10988_c0_g1_i2:722-1777(+)
MELLSSYTTSQMVTIENRRLGVLYISLVVLSLAIMITSIFYQKGYLEYDVVLGAAITKLDWEGKLDTSQLSYCQKKKCVIWDTYEAGLSNGGGNLLIVTRVKETKEKRKCGVHSSLCDSNVWEELSVDNWYIAGVESMVLKVSHSYLAPHFYEDSGHSKTFSSSNKEMAGVLLKGQGEEVQVLQVFNRSKYDSIPIQNLLAAAEVDSLDARNIYHEKNRTLRHTGFHMDLDISYNNVRCSGELSCWFGTRKTTYRHRANLIPQDTFVTLIVNQDETNGTRVRRSLYGIEVSVKQSGRIGRFSYGALLSRLVEGVGMLTMANLIVDFFASYLSAHAPTFVAYKYVSKKLEHK